MSCAADLLLGPPWPGLLPPRSLLLLSWCAGNCMLCLVVGSAGCRLQPAGPLLLAMLSSVDGDALLLPFADKWPPSLLCGPSNGA